MHRRTFAVLVLSISVSACNRREPHDPLAVAPAPEPAPAKPKKPLAELFSAKAPTFPAIFNGVTPGMTVEEARKKIPGLDKDLNFELPDYDKRASLFASDGRILTMSLPSGKESLALATAAWGKPTIIKESGRDVNVWFNPEAKVRAKLESSEYSSVALQTYVPAAEFLGHDKAGPAFQKAHPLIGMTPDDVRKNYPANVLDASAEANTARMKDVQAFAGSKIDLGPSKASTDLLYPPTEYGSYEMKVNLYYNKGKVSYYTFGVEYGPFPEQKTHVLALLMKTYGEPKRVKDLGTPLLQFRKAPTVKVEDDTISNKWSFTVEK